jgi:predicted dehydrogenase
MMENKIPDTANPTLRVAMIGAGMISWRHLTAWRGIEGAKVVAIVDPVADRALARAREFGIARYYDDIDDLLRAERVDAIDIASPRETHATIIRTAAERSIAILCQKPLVASLAEARQLLQSLPSGTRLMVNQNFRFRPYYLQIKRWIDEGRFGTLNSCTIACRSCGLLPDQNGRYPYIDRQPFVRNEDRLMIAEVLIHRFDVARWLCGPLEVVAARTYRSCPELVGESEASVLLQSKSRPIPVFVDGNFMSIGYPKISVDRVEITGSRARGTLDNHVLRLHGPVEETLHYDTDEAIQSSFNGLIAHFVDCLRTGAPFLTDAVDNLETLQLVEAAYVMASTAQK